MNDFTKEELEHLLKIMDHCYLDAYGQELGRKIQSLIDNYCEHDCKETIWQCQVTACSKCGFPSTVLKR